MARLVYIMGLGRSGSTILDIVLGNHGDIKGCGQLAEGVTKAFPNGNLCACGDGANECTFWSDVRERYVGSTGDGDFSALASLQEEIEPYSNFLKLLLNRVPRETLEMYGVRIGALINAISAASGNSIVLDSSKNPCRALAILRCKSVDLHLIHLTRDCRGFVQSRKKRQKILSAPGAAVHSKVRPAWRSCLAWNFVNVLSLATLFSYRRKTGRRGVVVTYEDFTADPENTLRRIGAALDVDFQEPLARIMRGDALELDHRLECNRVGFSADVKLRRQDEWKSKLSAADRLTFYVLSGPLASYYWLRGR